MANSPIKPTSTCGDCDITVESYGAKPGDVLFDNTAAINAAEAAAAATGARVVFCSGADYYFQGTLVGARDRLVWSGHRTKLIYNGSDNTRDLLVFGDGLGQFSEMDVSGLEVCTLTNMVAPSSAVHAKKIVRSSFHFDNIQGQDWQQANPGRRIWNGFWANQTDNVRLFSDAINATGDGVRVNGGVGSSGPKADFWVNVGKISGCKNGILLGGAFGGLYLGPQTTLINNACNLRIDQSLAAEQNRELFCTGTIFDVANGALATDANIIFDDPGDLRTSMTGCWISAGQSHGIWIKRSGGKLALVGGRIIGNKGDGFRTEVAGGGYTILSGVQISDNSGWAVNGRVAGYSVIVDACWFAGNVLGMVNSQFPNNGLSRNEAAQFPIVHTTKLQGDTGDFLQYDRTKNTWESFNGNVSNVAWGTNTLRVGSTNPFVRYQEWSSTGPASGVIAVSHGDSNLPAKVFLVQGWYKDGGVTRPLNLLSVNGSNFNFVADAAASGKPIRCCAWFLDAPRPW